MKQQRIDFQIYKQLMHLNTKKLNYQIKKKMDRRPKQAFLQRIHTNGQQTHEKMVNIIHY